MTCNLFTFYITPAPSEDWSELKGDCEDHYSRMREIQREVSSTIGINAAYQFIQLLPITFLGKYLIINKNNIK